MEKSQFYQLASEFLSTLNDGKKPLKIGEDENLLQAGYIDSLRMIELVLFVEKLSKKKIPLDKLDPRTFYTLGSLYETFFKGDHGK